ncbi:MAG: STAS domain-containing protein [bacterium]
MREGVTIVNPEATYIDEDVAVGSDTVIEPGVSLLGATRVGRSCTLRSGSSITDSTLGYRVTVRQNCVIASSEIASDVVLGPFAHLRDGAIIEEEARIGNFVEVKKSRVGRGSKALHLTYLGDATLGDKVNVGAGTVTCNYDGEKKSPTHIEPGVFVGSGTMLVAPLRVGRNSYIAAGSTITEDVPQDSLALGRARQIVKEGWARKREPIKPAVTIIVREVGAVTVLDVGGRLTLGEPVTRLNQALRSAFDSGVLNLLINLAKLVYIDSAGMGALVSALKTSQASGKRLKLSAIPQKVRVLLETANLDRVFEIHPDEAQALASLGEKPPA